MHVRLGADIEVQKEKLIVQFELIRTEDVDSDPRGLGLNT